LSATTQTQKRLMQKLTSVPPPGNKFFANRQNALLNKTERRTPHTSHTYIAGEVVTTPTSTKSANVVISPTYDLPLTLTSGNYPTKAFVSLDGLFRPFSTSVSVSGIAHFETPTASGSNSRNVSDLNPYQSGTDIFGFSRDTRLPTGDTEYLNEMSSDNVRAMALRGPLVLSGWGYDTNGKPVPNESGSNPTDNFLSGYLQNSDQWKTGPVDLRWDNRRKVWTGGQGAFRVAKLEQMLLGGNYASGVLLTPTFNAVTNRLSSWTEESGKIRIYDGFEYAYPTTPSGTRVFVQKEETSSEWFVFAAGIF
jgi:hypothetical protein